MAMNSQTNISLDASSIFCRQKSSSICKNLGATTISLIDHAPSSLLSIQITSPRASLLQMPQYKYLKVLQAFREHHVIELGNVICSTKCRYCNPQGPVYDIFNETKKLPFPSSNELMFWDSLQRCKLRSQWGHWPQVYTRMPAFKRRQKILLGHNALEK